MPQCPKKTIQNAKYASFIPSSNSYARNDLENIFYLADFQNLSRLKITSRIQRWVEGVKLGLGDTEFGPDSVAVVSAYDSVGATRGGGCTGAVVRAIDPSSKSVGDVGDIASSSTVSVRQISVRGNASRVVNTSRRVDVAIGIESLSQTASGGCSLSAIDNHLLDGCSSVCSVVGRSVMGLHQAGVDHPVVGSRNADTADRLLHDHSQDEAVIDAGRSSHGLDTRTDVSNFSRTVVSSPTVVATANCHVPLVGSEHVAEADPGGFRWEGSCSTLVVGVHVRAGADSIAIIHAGDAASSCAGKCRCVGASHNATFENNSALETEWCSQSTGCQNGRNDCFGEHIGGRC